MTLAVVRKPLNYGFLGLFSSLDGIKHVTSVSIEDEARIQLEFNMGTDFDVAATDIREAQCTLPKDGTQCTLLGLLALGEDNCCAEEPEEKPRPTTDTTEPNHEQKTLFDDDEELKRQTEEARRQAEIKRKQEEEERKRKKKKHEKDTHQNQGGNGNWFTNILNKGKSIFDDNEDSEMK